MAKRKINKLPKGTRLRMLVEGVGPAYRWPVGSVITVGAEIDGEQAGALLQQRAAKIARDEPVETATPVDDTEKATGAGGADEPDSDAGEDEDAPPALEVDFASPEAAELAESEELTTADFAGRTPGSEKGYTKSDVEGVVESKAEAADES